MKIAVAPEAIGAARDVLYLLRLLSNIPTCSQVMFDNDALRILSQVRTHLAAKRHLTEENNVNIAATISNITKNAANVITMSI